MDFQSLEHVIHSVVVVEVFLSDPLTNGLAYRDINTIILYLRWDRGFRCCFVSPSVSIKDVEVLVDNIVKKGVAYAVGLISFLHSDSDYYRYRNVVATLEPAFGVTVATKVYNDLAEAFKNIDMYAKVVIEGNEIWLNDYLRRRVLREDVVGAILSEAEKRFQQMLEEDRRVLSVAYAIIDVLKTKSYPAIHVSYPSWKTNGIKVSSTDGEYFSKLVSSVLGTDIPNVRALFYKYLLGFQCDSESTRHDYYDLEIYPFTISLLESLAANVSRYVVILDRFSIRSKLGELYQKGEYAKLAVIERSLSTRSGSEFLSYFFGKPYEHLCTEAFIEGIMSKCFVNPLVYDYVKEAVSSLYGRALGELIAMFKAVFEKTGYSVSCVSERCIVTKVATKPIHVYFYPWPKDSYFELEDFAGAVKAVVIQGMPTQSVLQARELQYYSSSKGYLWLFVEENRIAIASNTYRHEDHYELLNILRDNFTLEVIGPVIKELESLLLPAKPVTVVAREDVLRPAQLVKRFGARDPLEDVVASVLKSLGFSVKVDYKVAGRAGTEVEIDVWGEKAVDDMKFAVYASCKNWDRPVEVGVVREEFGRILQLPYIPHVRVIVASAFTESARREALADGFVVIETGEKVSEGNLERVYQRVYERLNRLLIGVAPRWMQELAEKARSIAEEIKKLSEELEKAAGTVK